MTRWAPPLLAVTSWLLVLAAVGLLVVSTTAGVEDNLFHYQDAAVGIVFPLLGWLVLRKVGSHPVAWILSVAGLSGAIGAFAEEYVTVGVEAHPGILPALGIVAWVGGWLWALFFSLLPVLLLLFPDGRLPSPRWRVAAGVVAAPVVLLPTVLAIATSSMSLEELAGSAEPAFPPVLDILFQASVVLFMAGMLLALGSLLVRWRRSHAVVRQQLKVFTFAAVIGVICLTLSQVDIPLADALGVVAFLLVPAGIVAAILRHRLYDIDQIVSRTVTYGVVTALLGSGYVGAVFVLRTFLPGQSDLAVAASTLGVAALFNPVRRWIQGIVDRQFNRSRYDAERLVGEFGRRLRSVGDIDNLRDELVSVVAATMEPTETSLWLADEDGVYQRPSRRAG